MSKRDKHLEDEPPFKRVSIPPAPADPKLLPFLKEDNVLLGYRAMTKQHKPVVVQPVQAKPLAYVPYVCTSGPFLKRTDGFELQFSKQVLTTSIVSHETKGQCVFVNTQELYNILKDNSGKCTITFYCDFCEENEHLLHPLKPKTPLQTEAVKLLFDKRYSVQLFGKQLTYSSEVVSSSIADGSLTSANIRSTTKMLTWSKENTGMWWYMFNSTLTSSKGTINQRIYEDYIKGNIVAIKQNKLNPSTHWNVYQLPMKEQFVFKKVGTDNLLELTFSISPSIIESFNALMKDHVTHCTYTELLWNYEWSDDTEADTKALFADITFMMQTNVHL